VVKALVDLELLICGRDVFEPLLACRQALQRFNAPRSPRVCQSRLMLDPALPREAVPGKAVLVAKGNEHGVPEVDMAVAHHDVALIDAAGACGGIAVCRCLTRSEKTAVS